MLCILALGGLFITASLKYSTTVMVAARTVQEDMKGIYAAEAGLEHTLWSLKNGSTPLTGLTEEINGMTVNMSTNNTGTYTLFFGQMIYVDPNGHSDFLSVSTNVSWDSGEGAYKYVIAVTLQTTSTIHLWEVGARLPPGYSYVDNSAAGFPENLSDSEPTENLTQSAWMLRWVFSSPYPDVSPGDPVATQTFYIAGTGNLEGDYGWVVARRPDIGTVGEITGTLYKITATARRPGQTQTIARIEAEAIVQGGTVYLASWRVTN